MLDDLEAAITRHIAAEPAVPRLALAVVDEPVVPFDVLYEPLVCFTANGSKSGVAGERSWTVGRGEMFLNSLVMPVTATFDELPYRAAVLSLDGGMLADLVLELDLSEPARTTPGGQITAPMTPDITDAVTRWVRLLDTPEHIGPLAHRVETEILYRLLVSPLGPMLRDLTLTDTAAARVRTAARWISAHFTEPLTVEAIAAVAHMSTASLYRHFKTATGMSPLNFQKHLRLQEARRRLLADDTTAAQVAEAVGYVSPTQFNREYRRAYGLPPAQDAARLRGELAGTGRVD
ncbi:AraC family transcriptional regulator [Saccharopolyspora flava]|uniref:Transcriptional regulator, AraC family n=1 Tax=Saccharopolyspora flava TaxID=95161 RepID=A0A1I6UDL4_9PSEU|nr:AraC family transcriptional regulator [Saccharopolyspora flava]SFS99504.1 transcriptional regulator, AraC family [Saccharopolyspora flava]